MYLPTVHKGSGLIEVLVALLVLSIAILGFVGLQLRAASATAEAMNHVDAMNVAADMAERMRANPLAKNTYISNLNEAVQNTSTMTCISSSCSSTQFANFDTANAIAFANGNGLKIAAPLCGGTGSANCLVVAWGKTNASRGTQTSDCINSSTNTYVADSNCIIMELYK